SRFIATTLLVLSSFLFSASAQATSDEYFITVWDMPMDDLVLTFPSEGIDTDIDMDALDCGANLVLPVILPVMVGGSPTCTYRVPGTYIVKASKGITGFNLFANGGDAAKLIDVKQWGAAEWSSEGLMGAFNRAANMRMSATDAPKLGAVTNMQFMFFSTGVFNDNISNWDVSSVTNMNSMFSGAGDFNQDIGDWVVSNVENMQGMFAATSNFNQDISRWDVSSIGSSEIPGSPGNMLDMFANTAVFNQNLGRWFVTAQTAVAVATPIRLVAQNTWLTGSYGLVEGDGDTNNDLFTLPNTGVLSLNTPDPATRTYSLRIGVTGTGTLGRGVVNTVNDEVAIRVTFRDSDEGARVYDIEVLDDLGLSAEKVAAAETQILNAILPQLLRATTKITRDNISNRIDQAFSSSPADTDASLNLGGSSSLQELINNNARTTLQDGLNI
ncbi:MAG: DUF285 domain-containing protein, partial [Methylococcales symbiont of Hymedesmia sp. n. MRB-2018]